MERQEMHQATVILPSLISSSIISSSSKSKKKFLRNKLTKFNQRKRKKKDIKIQ